MRRFTEFLKTNGLATDEELAALAADVDREVTEAALQALAAPKPAKNTAERWLSIYRLTRPGPLDLSFARARASLSLARGSTR